MDFPSGFRWRTASASYYAHRKRFNDLLAGGDGWNTEAAALFYYLNRTGYNGLCRFNRSGGFSVPFGQYTRITYARNFKPYRELFAQWEFAASDFERIPLEPDDFVYADPPYDVEFTVRDGWLYVGRPSSHGRVARKHKGPVALSNQATKRIVELYERLAS